MSTLARAAWIASLAAAVSGVQVVHQDVNDEYDDSAKPLPSIWGLSKGGVPREFPFNLVTERDEVLTQLSLVEYKVVSTKNFQSLRLAHEDFEKSTWLVDQPVDSITAKLKTIPFDYIVCWDSWATESIPPVYGDSRGDGEVRAGTSWFGAMLSLGYNVLVTNDHICERPMIRDLVGPGKALLGSRHAAPQMTKRDGKDFVTETEDQDMTALSVWDESIYAYRKVLKPCMFEMSYFTGTRSEPRMVSQFREWMWRDLKPDQPPKEPWVRMDHIGFISQAWNNKQSDLVKKWAGNLIFWNKGFMKGDEPFPDAFPQCMRTENFWKDVTNLVKKFNTDTGNKARVVCFAPGRWVEEEDPGQVIGNQLARIYKKYDVDLLHHFLPHPELMALLKASRLMFGMGLSTGSPMPYDAMELGLPTFLPRNQHYQLQEINRSFGMPFKPFDDCKELLSDIKNTLYDTKPRKGYTLPDYQADRIRAKMDVFSRAMKETCAKGGNGTRAVARMTELAREAFLTSDGPKLVHSKDLPQLSKSQLLRLQPKTYRKA